MNAAVWMLVLLDQVAWKKVELASVGELPGLVRGLI